MKGKSGWFCRIFCVSIVKLPELSFVEEGWLHNDLFSSLLSKSKMLSKERADLLSMMTAGGTLSGVLTCNLSEPGRSEWKVKPVASLRTLSRSLKIDDD